MVVLSGHEKAGDYSIYQRAGENNSRDRGERKEMSSRRQMVYACLRMKRETNDQAGKTRHRDQGVDEH
ncbi:MAG: hypothetical protein D6E12_16660 [Desulfovibrio sp.]|nr:MAG: hypothetical protein D6E12_16660 [Desulfovibrio sp.]